MNFCMQVIVQLMLALQTFGSPVELLSRLPEDPIDPPDGDDDDWAIGHWVNTLMVIMMMMVMLLMMMMLFITINMKT